MFLKKKYQNSNQYYSEKPGKIYLNLNNDEGREEII